MWGAAVVIAVGATACGRVGFRASAGDAAAADTLTSDAPATFCATVQPAPLLCDDFDELPFGERWAGANIDPNGMLMRDPTEFASSPDALFVKSPINGAYGAQVALYQVFSMPFTRGSIELDFRIDSRGDATTRIVPARVVFGSSSIGFGTHGPSSEIVELVGGATTMSSGGAGIAVGQWTHVRLDVDLSTSPGTARLAFNGVQTTMLTLDPAFVPAAPRFEAGLPWIESTSTLWSVDLDNIVFQ